MQNSHCLLGLVLMMLMILPMILNIDLLTGLSRPVMSAHFLWEVGHSSNWLLVKILFELSLTNCIDKSKYCTEMCQAVTNHWTYVCNASVNPDELEDLVFRTNAGHVKQGLRCKHCRVNIHQSCGAKVLSDKVNSPWPLQSFKYRIKEIYWPVCDW